MLIIINQNHIKKLISRDVIYSGQTGKEISIIIIIMNNKIIITMTTIRTGDCPCVAMKDLRDLVPLYPALRFTFIIIFSSSSSTLSSSLCWLCWIVIINIKILMVVPQRPTWSRRKPLEQTTTQVFTFAYRADVNLDKIIATNAVPDIKSDVSTIQCFTFGLANTLTSQVMHCTSKPDRAVEIGTCIQIHIHACIRKYLCVYKVSDRAAEMRCAGVSWTSTLSGCI